MAVDYRDDQLDTISTIQAAAATILDTLTKARAVIQEAIDKGYSPVGGANPITDAILQTPINGAAKGPFPDLSAADITAVSAAITAIDTALAANTRTHYKALARMR